jgi:competence protein ComGC
MELVMVVTMVGVLASIAIPSYMNYIEKARSTQCHVDRGEVQNIIVQYHHNHSDTELQSLQQLVDEGYLHSGSNCPLGGEYVLISTESVASAYPVVACSMHYVPELLSEPTPEPAPEPTPVPTPKPTPKPLTSLGSSFTEITQGMIDLVEKFYKANGKYPKKGKKRRFTDIGLDTNEWQNAINGVQYIPYGNRILIKPGAGYTFSVTDQKGKELTVSKNKKLIYSVINKQWYYNNIKKGKEVDISTLQVTQ